MPPSLDRLGCLARNALIECPVAAGDADGADALVACHDRTAAFHCGPALSSRGKRKAECVCYIECLSLCTLGARGAAIGRSTHGFRRRRVHGVKATAFHPL